MRLLASQTVLLAVVCGCGGPPAARVCRSSASCGDGEACVVSTCSPASGASPVSPTAKRLLVEPDDMVFVLSDDDDGPIAAAPFGATSGPRARLLLRFPHLALSGGTIEKAWLVLDRADGALAGPGDVTLRAERIVDAWSRAGGAGTTWASPPRAVPVEGAQAIVAARGNAPIRIDVTLFARELAKKGPRPWGLRVEGKGDGYGVPIATGLRGGRPRLEVYVVP